MYLHNKRSLKNMEILKRLDKYKKFLNVLLGIFGFVTLAFGVFIVIFTFVFADEEGSLYGSRL